MVQLWAAGWEDQVKTRKEQEKGGEEQERKREREGEKRRGKEGQRLTVKVVK